MDGYLVIGIVVGVATMYAVGFPPYPMSPFVKLVVFAMLLVIGLLAGALWPMAVGAYIGRRLSA